MEKKPNEVIEPSKIDIYIASRQILNNLQKKIQLRDLAISPEEEKANDIFLSLVYHAKTEIPTEFNFVAQKYRKEVEETSLYKTIKKMPKGSLHHLHLDCYLPAEWFVKQTYDERLWLNKVTGDVYFFKENNDSNWVRIASEREKAENKDAFDLDLKRLFEINITTLPCEWEHFRQVVFNRIAISCKWPFAENHIRDCFKLAIEEGYINVQLKLFLNSFQDENDKVIDNDTEVNMFKKVLEEIKKTEPLFTANFIYIALRDWDAAMTKKSIESAYQSKLKHGNIILGYDIVGDEQTRDALDIIHVFIDNIEEQKKVGVKMPFVFHAGETNSSTNTNIYDSIILENCPRIGHGINLFKHAYLYELIKKNEICIEINPLSNQTLGMVMDTRIHPGASFHSYGIKISINTDDPGVFRTDANLEFFACAISLEFDLLSLKRIIIDSIDCSLLSELEIQAMKSDFLIRWDKFIQHLLSRI